MNQVDWQLWMDWLSGPALERLGWVLIHSLWQLALIGSVAWLFDSVLRRNNAQTRYWTSVLFLAMMASTPLVTWFLVESNSKGNVSAFLERRQAILDADDHHRLNPGIESDRMIANASPAWEQQVDGDPRVDRVRENASAMAGNTAGFMTRHFLKGIVIAWWIGGCIAALRPIVSWFHIRRLKTCGLQEISDELGMRVARLVGLFLAKRKVAVWQSSLVRSPIVVGLFQSTILLPMGLVAQLSPQQIEWIIAHELAHVRRHDYLINLLQTWVETLFFFHPMVWWLSHRVRVEREHCCDDMVVEKLGNPSQYGRALLAIEEWNHAESVFALGARDGTLLARVQRLAQRDAKRPSMIGYPISLVLISLLTVVGTGIAWNSLQGGFPGSQEPVSDASNAFGRESFGLQCRLVAIPAGLQAKSIDWSRANVTFATAEEMAFAVEIKNTSRMPISLLSEVFHIAPDNSQPLRWNESWFDQSRFEFDFRDANGNRVPRPVREFFQPWTLGLEALPCELLPNQSAIVLLRPGAYPSPMAWQLPSGSYEVAVRYRGPNEVMRREMSRFKSSPAIESVWSHEVDSKPIRFSIEQNQPIRPLHELVWGKSVNGLQAAIEFRKAENVEGDPGMPIGYPIGSKFKTIVHVRNSGTKAVSFISETARQGDRVVVTDEKGVEVTVRDVWFSGWPVDVAWKLEPGESAPLEILTPLIGEIDKLGRYNVKMTLRFASRSMKDPAGNTVFPREGDYTHDLETGEASLWLQKASSVHASDRPGKWQVMSGVELELESKLFHGADLMTTAFIHWASKEQAEARYVPVHIASDFFGNREKYLTAWEDGKPELWWMKKIESFNGQGSIGSESQVHRLDYSRPLWIIEHLYDGYPDDLQEFNDIRSKFESTFHPKLNGKETYRYYRTSLPGSEPPVRDTGKIMIFLDPDEKCRVSSSLPDSPHETPCTLDTVGDVIENIANKLREIKGIPPLYLEFGAAPQYPIASLRKLLANCSGKGVILPVMPESDGGQASNSNMPWRAFGKVVDDQGRPLKGVRVRAATGVGTLRGGGSGETDAEGNYDFKFGFGVLYGNEGGAPSAQTQYAFIAASMDGYFEKNMNRNGDGIASLREVSAADLKHWSVEANEVCLPERPRRVDFVMVPAARFRGILVDEKDQPLANYSVALGGENLAPGSSVHAQVLTDAEGRFRIDDIPTTSAFHIEVRKPRNELKPPWNDSWASGSVFFEDPGSKDLRIRLEKDDKSIARLEATTFRLKIQGPGIGGRQAIKAAQEKALIDPTRRPKGEWFNGTMETESFEWVLSNGAEGSQ